MSKVTSDNFNELLEQAVQEGVDHATGVKEAQTSVSYKSKGKIFLDAKEVHCPDCNEDCSWLYEEDEKYKKTYYCPVCDVHFKL